MKLVVSCTLMFKLFVTPAKIFAYTVKMGVEFYKTVSLVSQWVLLDRINEY